ncbi:hypothetical protein L249_6751 [Ophiocordyceps polyrhachis-furcata BCC 54312]|uniref:U three protein 23 n=1 Tax=Ophiocordyceps polyrhachis-furcata BCC 54312 TaxID=1330021 RepID=A0A367LLU6_9HYPO|nr:hypothetical protein L249_6751 [Ophiocordyceps polyrhachis-furcata BCC 54312]
MRGMRATRLPVTVVIPTTFLSTPSQLFNPIRRRSASSTSSPTERRRRPPQLPFRFETGIALFAKRAPRPFPPPFLSPPSASFSDPLSTHHQSRNRRGYVNGELLRGLTNGDDAVYVSDFFVCANDGVGAWATRPRGHAGLWSRLILHFWAAAIEEERATTLSSEAPRDPHPVATLQAAYQKTLDATVPHDWQGTTTTCGAQLHYRTHKDADEPSPLLYVTNLGDSRVMVVRPRTRDVVYKTTEQWHWFDCPRQLGTNSPDTPEANAVTDVVELEVGDVILAISDGVVDNLWEHEIVESVVTSIAHWESAEDQPSPMDRTGGRNGGMNTLAEDLMKAARIVAVDPFAESPFMERAIEEGLASEGAGHGIITCREERYHTCHGKFITAISSAFSNITSECDSLVCLSQLAASVKMRGKRSKQYRKLMEQFSMTFGFREPYQVLVDAEMVFDTCRCKMDLEPALQRTVHGKVKPMITQCEIRKLYARKDEPGVSDVIDAAKSFERRRCGHHPDEYPEPLSTMDCMRSVIDAKDKGDNKHRYVVASQSQEVRRMLRGIRGVPLIYVRRSVMILEPMSDESALTRARDEKSKFRAEIKATLGKRKREEVSDGDRDDTGHSTIKQNEATSEMAEKKKKKKRGPKGPNPLSVKKSKKPQAKARKQEDVKMTAGDDGS